MALNFPNNPAPGSVFRAEGRAFVWNGAVWIMQDLGLPWASFEEVAAGVRADGVISPGVMLPSIVAIPEPAAPFQGTPTVMGAQRAVNVDYQNTFDRDMMIILAMNGSGGAALRIGQGGPGNARLGEVSIVNAGHLSVLTAVVSPGLFYRMNLSSGTITQWVEYR